MSAPTPRLRFAPSPTGYLHVGGARTALFNWLFAKKFGGQLLLRIEDTDKARSTDDSTRAIFEGLEWLGLGWDEEVVYQGANLERHRADALRLLENGTAYRCFCTQAELAERRAEAEARKEAFRYDRRCDRLSAEEIADRLAAGMPFTVRFRVPEGTTSWTDLVHDEIAFPNKDIEDFIVLRTDGTPIYNLAVVSDDIAMRITLVMRGDDHISNTPKQILLYRALGAELPQFAHLPMIHGLDGKKLSKRHGATAVGDYQHLGILPGAMLNFLALLGWSPGNDIEVMSMDQMIELFDPAGLQKKAAIFDPKKLEWMNGQHLSLMPSGELLRRVAPKMETEGLATRAELEARRDWFIALLDLLKVRARTIDDIVRQAYPYFHGTITYDPDAVAKQWKDRPATASLLLEVRNALAALEQWEPAAMEEALRALAERLGYGDKAGKLFQPLRVALTGLGASPGIFDVLVMLGRDRSLARLDDAVTYLRAPGSQAGD
ncbi:MAG TPA: glutamate--tRNA ligase [Gemmatimonadaceae bacterium]|jgi:glutamyl-tRNA synthetase|nr:glutamate--tRNA ligase [Gemmatimonadaceae bacterium]